MFLRFLGWVKLFAIYAPGLSGVNFGISGDVFAQPIPEFYGVYAVDNNRLHELRPITGNKTEDLANAVSLSVNARFIVFDKLVAGIAANIHFDRMVFRRNFVVIRRVGEGRNTTESLRVWSTSIAPEVELRSKPVEGQSEMVYLVPRTPLRAGVYKIRLSREELGTFVVDKKSILSNPESSESCIDFVIDYSQSPGGKWREIETPCVQSGAEVTAKPSSPDVRTTNPVETPPSPKQEIEQQQLKTQVFRRTFSAPLEDTWASILRVLNEQKDKIETIEKGEGIIITTPSRRGGWTTSRYVKYYVRVTAPEKSSTTVSLGVEILRRNKECGGCIKTVKAKYVDKWKKESAEEFFSKLDSQL